MEAREDSLSKWGPTGAKREEGALELEKGVLAFLRNHPTESLEDPLLWGYVTLGKLIAYLGLVTHKMGLIILVP